MRTLWPRLIPLLLANFTDMLAGAQAPTMAPTGLSTVLFALAVSTAVILVLRQHAVGGCLVFLVVGLLLAHQHCICQAG